MAPKPKSFQETIRELWELLTTYAKQETVGPLKNLGRRIGFGIAGSLLFSLGWFLLTMALIRFLDTHTLPWVFGDFFREHDWVTYFAALVVLGLGVLGAVLRIKRPDEQLATPGGAALSTGTRSA